MNIEWQVDDIPDNLQAGQYATRVKSSSIVNGKILIILEFVGDIDPDNPSLFTMTKHDDSNG